MLDELTTEEILAQFDFAITPVEGIALREICIENIFDRVFWQMGLELGAYERGSILGRMLFRYTVAEYGQALSLEDGDIDESGRMLRDQVSLLREVHPELDPDLLRQVLDMAAKIISGYCSVTAEWFKTCRGIKRRVFRHYVRNNSKDLPESVRETMCSLLDLMVTDEFDEDGEDLTPEEINSLRPIERIELMDLALRNVLTEMVDSLKEAGQSDFWLDPLFMSQYHGNLIRSLAAYSFFSEVLRVDGAEIDQVKQACLSARKVILNDERLPRELKVFLVDLAESFAKNIVVIWCEAKAFLGKLINGNFRGPYEIYLRGRKGDTITSFRTVASTMILKFK